MTKASRSKGETQAELEAKPIPKWAGAQGYPQAHPERRTNAPYLPANAPQSYRDDPTFRGRGLRAEDIAVSYWRWNYTKRHPDYLQAAFQLRRLPCAPSGRFDIFVGARDPDAEYGAVVFGDQLLSKIPEHYVLFLIDPNGSAKRQLAEAKRLIDRTVKMEREKNASRLREAFSPVMLRALDAKAAGASYREIGWRLRDPQRDPEAKHSKRHRELGRSLVEMALRARDAIATIDLTQPVVMMAIRYPRFVPAMQERGARSSCSYDERPKEHPIAYRGLLLDAVFTKHAGFPPDDRSRPVRDVPNTGS